MTCPPQVGPTEVTETSSSGTWASLAREVWTSLLTLTCWAAGRLLRSACTSIDWWAPVPRSSTVGWVSPAASTASWAWVWVTPGAGTIQAWPPLKSMPRLSPRKPSESMPATMMMPEIRNHHSLRPTKSNEVSPL